MCEIRTVIIVAALLSAAAFCLYQVNSEKKLGQTSRLKSESLVKKSTGDTVWTVMNAII